MGIRHMKWFAKRTTAPYVLAALLGVGLWFGPATAMAAVKMIISNDVPEGTLKGETWKRVVDDLNADFPGGIDVELHNAAALYTQGTQIEALQLGAIQAIGPALGLYTGQFPKLTVFALPFLLPTAEAIAEAIADPEVKSELFDEVEKAGMKVVAIWLNGPRYLSTKAAPVLEPSELRGVKIRVPGGANYVESFKAVGANVLAMNWSEVPTAIQQGVVEAIDIPPNVIFSLKTYEMLPQITDLGYILDTYLVTVNAAWFDGLTPEQQERLVEVFDKASAWNWERASAANSEAIQKINSAGGEVHELTPAQRLHWKESMQPVWTTVGEPLVGGEFIAKLQAIGDQYR